jgi:hypothetical protein
MLRIKLAVNSCYPCHWSNATPLERGRDEQWRGEGGQARGAQKEDGQGREEAEEVTTKLTQRR